MFRLLIVVTCLFGIGFYVFTLTMAWIHGTDIAILAIMAALVIITLIVPLVAMGFVALFIGA